MSRASCCSEPRSSRLAPHAASRRASHLGRHRVVPVRLGVRPMARRHVGRLAAACACRVPPRPQSRLYRPHGVGLSRRCRRGARYACEIGDLVRRLLGGSGRRPGRSSAAAWAPSCAPSGPPLHRERLERYLHHAGIHHGIRERARRVSLLRLATACCACAAADVAAAAAASLAALAAMGRHGVGSRPYLAMPSSGVGVLGAALACDCSAAASAGLCRGGSGAIGRLGLGIRVPRSGWASGSGLASRLGLGRHPAASACLPGRSASASFLGRVRQPRPARQVDSISAASSRPGPGRHRRFLGLGSGPAASGGIGGVSLLGLGSRPASAAADRQRPRPRHRPQRRRRSLASAAASAVALSAFAASSSSCDGPLSVGAAVHDGGKGDDRACRQQTASQFRLLHGSEALLILKRPRARHPGTENPILARRA